MIGRYSERIASYNIYSIAVRNRYEALHVDNHSATEKYQLLIEANDKTTDELIPIKKRKQMNVLQKKKFKINEAFFAFKETPTKENQEGLHFSA